MKGRLVIDHANHITEKLRDLAEERGYKFWSKPEDSLGKDWDQISCALDGKDFQSNFQVQQMPGCCAVLVLSCIRVQPFSYELFDHVIEFVEEAARDAAFGSVAMTQVVPKFSKMFWNHEPWIKCLDRKWTVTPAFRNGKSGNLVVYLLKDLEQKEKRDGFETRFWTKSS